jgi:hypothetical protein
MSLRNLVDTYWRRRSDGWIGGIGEVSRSRAAGQPVKEQALLIWNPDTGPTTSDTVGSEEQLRERYQQIREVRCRRCHQYAWRIAGKGERYVPHGCSKRQRQRRIERILREEQRAYAGRMYDLLNHLTGEYADPIDVFMQSARTLIETIDQSVNARARKLRRS